jgi:serine/threonine-protein kinase
MILGSNKATGYRTLGSSGFGVIASRAREGHMSPFAPEQWQALSPYLDQALEISPEERAAWLQSIFEKNPSLATELQTLLKEHHALDDAGFLQTAAGAPPGASPTAGQTVGAYTLESPIGHGGMGTVWLAHRSDGRFIGRAALKFLSAGFVGSAGEERFKREGSFLARLRHPNIAHLIDAGVSASGQPYLVLEYVEGKQIDVYCNERVLEVDARLRLFLDVLAAVAHAHASLIVHRDLKPSNVLVTYDGQVKLLDFGIAKLLEDDAPAALTREGERALTLAYASPEQVTGGPISTATDVYALGVLLYLLLAGKHPSESALQSPADLIKAIVDTQPLRPSDAVSTVAKLSRALRGDLDTIVSKALKKNPGERYASVTALADDVRRYLAHQPISAQPDTLAYRARKFVRRNYLAVSLTALAFIATVAGVIGTVIQARAARIERDFALRQLSRAEAINDLDNFVLSDVAPAPMNELLARAERQVARRNTSDEADRIERMIAIAARYLDHSEYLKARRVLEQAYALARGLPDPSIRARTSCDLAVTLTYEGDFERAERLFEEGMKELRDDPPSAIDRAFCLSRGRMIAFKRGGAKDAVARAEAAVSALRKSPFKSEVLETDNLISLATSYRAVGRLRESNAAFEQASARLSALGYEETRRSQILFTNWGTTLSSWGRPVEAERVLHRAFPPGGDNSTAEVSPELLIDYARALKDLGRLEDSAHYGDLAYDRSKAVGHQAGIRAALLARTSARRMLGDLDRSTELLSELERAMRATLKAGSIGFAALHMEQALNAEARGDSTKALELANQAVAVAEAAPKQNRDRIDALANMLIGRSGIELKLQQADRAGEDARRALKMLADGIEPGDLSYKVGRAYMALGRALEAASKPEQAREAFRSAADHLQSALGADHPEAQAARRLAQPEL